MDRSVPGVGFLSETPDTETDNQDRAQHGIGPESQVRFVLLPLEPPEIGIEALAMERNPIARPAVRIGHACFLETQPLPGNPPIGLSDEGDPVFLPVLGIQSILDLTVIPDDQGDDTQADNDHR
jgi:hypothetical protein